MFRKTSIINLLSISFLFASMEANSNPKGKEIALEIEKRNIGWNSTKAELVMTLKNASGEESKRFLRISSIERNNPGLGDMSLTIFDEPADVSGTAFLSHTKIHEPDDQWLYLPALKRVKRISSKNKSGPFMGSEFAFEDLVSFEVEKYKHEFIEKVNCPSISNKCFVVDRYPTYKNSGYSKMRTWVDEIEYRVNKIVYYDKRNSLLKSLMLEDYNKFKGKFWRSMKLSMINHQTKKSTLIIYENWNFDVQLKKKNFKASKLKRMR